MGSELTYQVPFERLAKLSRTLRRQAFPVSWAMLWLWLGLFSVAIILLVVFDRPVQHWLATLGLPRLTVLLTLLVVFLAGLQLWRRSARRQVQSRTNFQSTVRLRQDDGGLHFSTDEIEYHLKWQGISQLLLAHEGLAVAHGSLAFFIPDEAFASLEARNAFIRDVFARLGGESQKRSEKQMRPVLAPTMGA